MADELPDELRITGEHVAVFNEIAKALTSSLEPREVLGSIMLQIAKVVRPLRWTLSLEDEVTGELKVELAVGDESKLGDKLSLPLTVRGRPLGVLELVSSPNQPMRREDLQALKAVADYAAIAIHNARNFRRLQELTITDDHTGLFNARHLRERLASEVERALRFNHPLSLIFIDLDHFKSINDEHGHVLGSVLLLEVGRVLSGAIRKVDSAYRYGGDEFAVMLVETGADAAVRVAKRLQARIEKQVFLAEKRLALNVTASFGVATFPDDSANAVELLQSADQAMYRAKSRGRNVVVSAGESSL